MPSCFSCCKSVQKEHEVNYITHASPPQHEALRLRLMEKIEKFNNELGNPKKYIEGKIFALTYETLTDPAVSHYLFKEIVQEHYNNNCMKVTESLLVDLENTCNVVRVLQGRERVGVAKQ